MKRPVSKKKPAFKRKYGNLYLEMQKLFMKLKYLLNSKNFIRNVMKKSLKSETESNISLDRVEAQKLSDTQKELCEKEIRESYLYGAMKNMVTNHLIMID